MKTSHWLIVKQSVHGLCNFYTICDAYTNRAKLIVGSLAFFYGPGIAPALDESPAVRRSRERLHSRKMLPSESHLIDI